MTTARSVRLRAMLEAHQTRLRAELVDHMRNARRHSPDVQSSDVFDRIEQFEFEALGYALAGLKTDTLHRVESALARLDEGEYGWCAECGEEISDRRLAALPFATRCRACESRTEAGPAWACEPVHSLFANEAR
jgi:RNA polymerase-binding transcription factor